MPKKSPKKKVAKKKKCARRKKIIKEDFDIELILLSRRQLFLYDVINEESAKKIIKEIYALDAIEKAPIVMHIDSPGGACSSGLAIINAMKTVESPIITLINNQVCSMGSHISVAGDVRACYESAVWMAHDMTSGIIDYSMKIEDRADFLKKYYPLLERNYTRYTKLSSKELMKARVGELWLFADDMLKKGIVDEIILHK